MKHYVITGSIGHISKPVVAGLIQAGKEVTVITSNGDKVKEIESLGAKALVGSVQDGAFVQKAFQGADVVYTMIPPIWQTNNWKASQEEVGRNYVNAIKSHGIQYVVDLSSLGAHLGKGCGPVDALHDYEQLLNGIEGLNVKHLRPSYFYYNLLNQIGLIRAAGMMGANFGGGDFKLALVHTRDIAAVALEELLNLNFRGNSVRYIVSDMVTTKEIVDTLGKVIDKEIPWMVFSDEQQLQGLLQGGVPPSHALAFVEMGVALRTGKMQEEIVKTPPVLGPTKLADFAKEFKAAYSGS